MGTLGTSLGFELPDIPGFTSPSVTQLQQRANEVIAEYKRSAREVIQANPGSPEALVAEDYAPNRLCPLTVDGKAGPRSCGVFGMLGDEFETVACNGVARNPDLSCPPVRATKPSPPSPPPPTPTTTSTTSTSKASSGNTGMVLAGLAAVAMVGAGAYYYYSTRK